MADEPWLDYAPTTSTVVEEGPWTEYAKVSTKTATPTPSPEDGLEKSFSKGVRGVIQGVGGLTDIVNGPVAAGVNWATGSNHSVSPGHDAGKFLADQLGLAIPEGDMEDLANAINEGGIQGILGAGAGKAIAGHASPIIAHVGKVLAESPLLDTLSGMMSGGAGEVAEQSGAGPWGQMGAAILGGISPFAVKGALGGLHKAWTDDGMASDADFVKEMFDTRGSDTTPSHDPRNVPEPAAGDIDISNRLQAAYDAGATSEELQTMAGGKLDPAHLKAMMDYRDANGRGGRFVPHTEAETRLAAEAAAFKGKASQEPAVTDLFPTEESLAAKSLAMEEKLTAEADAFKNRNVDTEIVFKGKNKAAESVLTEEDHLPQNVQDITNHVNDLTKDWDNAPDTVVYDHFDDFSELDPNSLGVFNPEDGKVYLNANAIDREASHRGLTQQEMTNTVMFHEGLGHHGLAQKFREDLDSTLDGFYKNSPYFRREVDKWIKKNPNSYTDENTTTRAGEEILAELSESGKMPVTFMNKIKNQIKDYARKAGIKLDFSEREIKTILAQAHEAVISGKGADVRGNGYRSMKSTFGSSEGSLQGAGAKEDKTAPSTINKFRSNRQLDSLFEEFAPEKTKETWGDWANEADRIKMTDKMARNLSTGTEVPELKAAEKYILKTGNSIKDLLHKSVNGTLTPTENALLFQRSESFQESIQALNDVVANAARILNSRNMEVATDEKLADRLLRKMMSSLSDSEMAALSTPEGAKAFAERLVKDTKKAERIQKSLHVWGNVLNFTRSIWSSFDLSAPFRQGRALAHTADFWKGIPSMFKYWGNEAFYDMTMKGITERPTYIRMKAAGVAFTELGTDLSKREEQFMSTWAEKIPGVKQSERAYNGYLNKLRADTFDTLVAKLEKQGVDFKKNPKILKDVAGFVNNATGRGDLGRFNQSAPILAGAFFSPRLMASRLQMLNPMYYAKLSAPVRKEAIKSMLAFAGTSLMVGYMFHMGGADVEPDPRSSDFMKIKTGDTRYDILGGFGQYITLGARLLSNEKKDSKGDVVTLGGRPGADNAWDVLGNFARSKLSPNASLLVDARLGENIVGEPFIGKDEAVKRFIPLIAQDTWDVMKKEGLLKGAAMSVPGVFGVSTQNYPGVKGADVYGRSYSEDREDTPTIKEVKRLEEVTGEIILNPVRSTLKIDGESVKLPEEVLAEYQKKAGEYLSSDLKAETENPLWAELSDEEKVEAVRKVSRDARKDAREELFGEQGE